MRAIMTETAPFAERVLWTMEMVAVGRPEPGQIVIDWKGVDSLSVGYEWLRR